MAAAARPAIWQCGLAMALTGSILLLATLVAKGVILDTYYSLAALAVAAIIFLAGKADLPRWLISVWKALGMLWLFIGAFVLLAIGYDQNNVLLFYGALTFGLLLLFASKRLFELSLIGTNIINTAILLVMGLPVADQFVKPPYALDFSPDPSKRYYSYESARKNPSAFRRWWDYYIRQWDITGGQIYMRDPAGVLPFRLRPNSRGKLFNSHVAINSKGFRGKEIPEEKGNAYRILVIGESTTFGATLYPEDRPWPDIVEQIIHDRLKLSRPVEVINGGVAAYTIVHNLSRFKTDFLPVKPDLILSYHGINGFGFIDKAIPRPEVDPPPPYIERPFKLLADLEYRAKLAAYKRRTVPKSKPDHALIANPLDTPCAKAYEDLYQLTHTNGIRLALANFSMAVTPDSPTDVIEFYRSRFPSIYWQMRANIIHSRLIGELAEKHPDISFVDMQPHLNGFHDKFIDLIHMTQEGRQQAAENAFAGLTNILNQLR
jgi:lysophospholipase L1-like esterase